VRTEVVVNANAALFARDPRLVQRVREAAGGQSRVSVTTSLEELSALARELRSAEVERVVLCGGDGSFMAGVTALAAAGPGHLPELVFAPGGTVATVARNLGQRLGLLETVARATDPRAHAWCKEHPCLRVVEAEGRSRLGFIFGTGLVARFFRRYYAGQTRGYAAAARIVARVFVSSFTGGDYARSVLDPLPSVVEVEGQRLAPEAYSLIVSSVVRNLGLHMLVTHRAAEDPERPHLVLSPLGPGALGPQAPRVLAGLPLRGSGGFDGLVRHFSVTFPEPDGPYVLDGDLFGSRRVEVSAGPRLKLALFA